MKYRKFGILLLSVVLLASLVSCDVIQDFIKSRTRNIALIKLYNSFGVETKYIQPNDTLYIEAQGLAPGKLYRVTCKDPEGKEITQLTALADADGNIQRQPLWYDVGLEKREIGGVTYVRFPTDSQLSLKAFEINIEDAGGAKAAGGATNFSLNFFVVIQNNISRPQPIVIAGKMVSGEFVAENNFNAGDQLYVKIYNLASITPAVSEMRIYIVPFKGTAYEEGDLIANALLYQDIPAASLTSTPKNLDSIQITGDWKKDSTENWNAGIPAAYQGKAFSVVLDCNADGYFNITKAGIADYYIDGIDGNMAPGFVVTKAPAPADLIKANIASGGQFSWDYATWTYDYDYRDTFKKDGSDTRYAPYYGVSRGVKAIWNPYINWGGSPPTPGTPSLYYGTYVDVYVVAKNDYTETKDADIKPAPGTHPIRVPVQYSCANGLGQQTIWSAPMTVGDYYVVVDMNCDGKMSDKDIVDDRAKDGTPRTNGGFSIVE